MISKLDKKNCTGCGGCVSSCPTQAIKMTMDAEGFYYPLIDNARCIKCNKCEKSCASLSPKDFCADGFKAKAYAMIHKDDEIRRRSTSGGAFFAIAESFFDVYKGIVYGVTFNESFRAIFDSASSFEAIKKFHGSKYCQASAGMVYRDVEEKLKSGKHVLFSGLPCHVQALRHYLGKKYPNLITVDIVCFGIGSSGLWEKYLDAFFKQDNIKNVQFKDKRYGWKKWGTSIQTIERDYYYKQKENLYMNSYLQGINIRPSCYSCNFKGIRAYSDFTIADCWGIGEMNSSLNDDEGLSALIINTKKGMELFAEIKKHIIYKEYEPVMLMEGNKGFDNCPILPPSRDYIMSDLCEGDFKEKFINYFKMEGFCFG